MTRAFAAFVLVALISSAGAQPTVVRITCDDGGRHGIIEGFGRKKKFTPCDIDQSCDGICTVKVPTPRDAHCAVDPRACPRTSSGPDVSPSDAFEHCSRQLHSDGVPVHASRSQRTFFRGRVMVRCRASTQCTPTTTTTLPPDIPDLTGEWTLIELDATDDCPAAVKTTPFAFLPEHHTVRVLQDGTRLFHCGGDVLVTQFAGSEVTADGFTFDTGDCCGWGNRDINFNVGQTLSATLPAENGTASVTQQWRISAGGPPGGPLVCTRTSHAVMSRIVHRCDVDEQCLDFGGCHRCIGGICLPAPECR